MNDKFIGWKTIQLLKMSANNFTDTGICSLHTLKEQDSKRVIQYHLKLYKNYINTYKTHRKK